MPSIVLHSTLIANSRQHSTVLSTSFVLAAEQETFWCRIIQNNVYIRMNRYLDCLDAALGYKNELAMVEERRQEMFNQESCWSKGAVNREQKWLDSSEKVI